MGSNVTNFGSFKASDSPSIDAFARWRVSNPETIFDSKQIHDNAPLFWDDQQTSGSGTTSTHSTTAARSRMAVSASTVGTRVRQTFQRFNYQPGKSNLCLMTFVMNSVGNGHIANVGMFDDEDGVFFSVDNGTYKVVCRSFVTGAAVNTSVSQSSWNLDKLDGNGPSGITLDASKTNIFIADYEWLGVGRVRIGFVIGGIPVYCHEFLNANTTQTAVYMSTPNLPLRYEIQNDGNGGAASLDHICASVISEGGSQEIGSLRYFSNDTTNINGNTAGTIYALCGIRLKPTALDASIIIENVTAINTTNDDFEWLLILNPTVANAITFSDQTNSAVQTGPGNSGNPSNSTLTSGTILSGGYVRSGTTTGSISASPGNAIKLGSTISGTPDEIYLAVRPLSVNADMYGSITWRELS